MHPSPTACFSQVQQVVSMEHYERVKSKTVAAHKERETLGASWEEMKQR